ncbi:MAG: NAD-dependent epimerase/dehydratase family protein [Solirubrobacteraceae bacterium]|nr:NAD-dependent epimerase/dehydratase family protein [Patulibacter sp.]
MRALVSGGAGFIGSAVVDALLRDGHTVHVVDDLRSGRLTNLVDSAATIHEVDILDPVALGEAFAEARPDWVFHLAAQIDVRVSMVDPTADSQLNVIGTIRMLEATAQSGASAFVNTSTGGAIYGDATSIPADESTLPLPLSPYGVSKYAAEQYVSWFGRTHGFRAITLRFANVYGPRQDPRGEAGVVAIFCERAAAGEAAVVYGDGEQTRDFLYVGDAAAAQLAAARHGENGGIYNIGTAVETSVRDLASAIGRTGRELPLTELPPRAGEVRRSALDPSLAARALGWTPTRDLASGLAETLDWVESLATAA